MCSSFCSLFPGVLFLPRSGLESATEHAPAAVAFLAGGLHLS